MLNFDATILFFVIFGSGTAIGIFIGAMYGWKSSRQQMEISAVEAGYGRYEQGVFVWNGPPEDDDNNAG